MKTNVRCQRSLGGAAGLIVLLVIALFIHTAPVFAGSSSETDASPFDLVAIKPANTTPEIMKGIIPALAAWQEEHPTRLITSAEQVVDSQMHVIAVRLYYKTVSARGEPLQLESISFDEKALVGVAPANKGNTKKMLKALHIPADHVTLAASIAEMNQLIMERAQKMNPARKVEAVVSVDAIARGGVARGALLLVRSVRPEPALAAVEK